MKITNPELLVEMVDASIEATEAHLAELRLLRQELLAKEELPQKAAPALPAEKTPLPPHSAAKACGYERPATDAHDAGE